MQIVFLLEELSMAEFLKVLLERYCSNIDYKLITHEGKSDLERSLPRKLRAWRTPGARFVVVRDQDSGDCREIKRRLVEMAGEAGRPETVIRIACRELEAWVLGDLEAIALAFGRPRVLKGAGREKFRQPDHLGSPSQEITRLVPEYQKVSGARRVARHLDPDRNTSHSFGKFFEALQTLVADSVEA